jgi:hypothetical protein
MPALGSSHMEDTEKLLSSLRELTRGLGLQSNTMNFSEAARKIGVGLRQLQALVRTGHVLTVTVGARRLVPAGEVARWRSIQKAAKPS